MSEMVKTWGSATLQVYGLDRSISHPQVGYLWASNIKVKIKSHTNIKNQNDKGSQSIHSPKSV